MSLDADSIVDRRRMRRKLTFWRALAVVVAIVAVVLVAARFAGPEATRSVSDQGPAADRSRPPASARRGPPARRS